jgi:alpha-D-ribose 1-methylphosphonate 5-triphosphate synthase subunit PhnG
MKIRDLTILLATLFGTIAAASAIVTVAVVLDNRGLRQEMRELRQSWNAVAGESRQLKLEKSETESAFSAQGERLEQLETELAAVRASMATNASSAAPAARAYRASVYLGQAYLGQGWIAPGQTGTDPDTGQARYEPMVLLDASVRARLAAGKTNVIEREVATPTTVNYNYPNPYPYYYYSWWPSVRTLPTNPDRGGPPERPPRTPPPAPQPPPDGRVMVTTRPYFPPDRPIVMPAPRPPRTGEGRPVLTSSPGRPLAVSNARPLSSPGN